jgi:hypothetical protein
VPQFTLKFAHPARPQTQGLSRASYRCYFFQSSKLAGLKDCEDKSIAQTAAQVALRWHGFDRAEVWSQNNKIEAWIKENGAIRGPMTSDT